MSIEENKAVVSAFGEAMRRQDLTLLQAHPGLAGSIPFYQQIFAAFPDMQGTVQEMVAEGAWIATRTMISGTMQGPYMGMAPTGKQAIWEVIQTFRIVDGTIVESHGQADVMGMMQQLGLGPVLASLPR